MRDITQLIFINSWWLLTGILFYYLLSAAKTFLLVIVQPQLFRADSEKPVLTVKTLFLQFLRDFFTDRSLHRYTYNYLLNKGGKAAWKLVGNRKINWYYNFLEVITVLLKPFMIIAMVWAVLKFLIWNRIAYDELQITLGQMQKTIAYLESLPFISTFDKYKGWLFIGAVVICGLLGIFKKMEKKISRARSFTYSCFTLLSIIAGLSFFGHDLHNKQNKSLGKLRELEFVVDTIHEHIYRDIAEAIVYEDLSQAIKEDVNNNERESHRLDSLIVKAPESIERPDVQNDLSEKLDAYNNEYKRSISLDVTIKTPDESIPVFKRVFSGYMTTYFQTNILNEKPTASERYWSNRDNWSKGGGLKYKEYVEAIKPDHYFDKETDEQVQKLVDNIVDYLGEELFSKGADFLGAASFELPKTIITFLVIEKCKECFVPKIANVIKSLGNRIQAIGNLRSVFCFKKVGKSGGGINSITAEHDKVYKDDIREAKQEEERRNANEEAKRMVKEKINNIVGDIAPKDPGAYNDFIDKIVEEYKKKLKIEDFSSKSVVDLKGLLVNGIIKGVLGSVRVHPFPPPPECPICAFQAGVKLFGGF